MEFEEAGDAINKIRRLTFRDINRKMEHFKQSSNSRKSIYEYILKQNKANLPNWYDFGVERDQLSLKVLLQILYEDIEKFIKNGVLKDKAHANELHLLRRKESMNKFSFGEGEPNQFTNKENCVVNEQNKILENNSRKVEAYKREVEELETEISEKKNLIQRLYEDKELFIKASSNLSTVLASTFSLLTKISATPIYAPPLSKDIDEHLKMLSEHSSFISWARSYEQTPDAVYINDLSFRKRSREELENYSSVLSKYDRAECLLNSESTNLELIKQKDSVIKELTDQLNEVKSTQNLVEDKINLAKDRSNQLVNKIENELRKSQSKCSQLEAQNEDLILEVKSLVEDRSTDRTCVENIRRVVESIQNNLAIEKLSFEKLEPKENADLLHNIILIAQQFEKLRINQISTAFRNVAELEVQHHELLMEYRDFLNLMILHFEEKDPVRLKKLSTIMESDLRILASKVTQEFSRLMTKSIKIKGSPIPPNLRIKKIREMIEESALAVLDNGLDELTGEFLTERPFPENNHSDKLKNDLEIVRLENRYL